LNKDFWASFHHWFPLLEKMKDGSIATSCNFFHLLILLGFVQALCFHSCKQRWVHFEDVDITYWYFTTLTLSYNMFFKAFVFLTCFLLNFGVSK
jgi:hypothetical protein